MSKVTGEMILSAIAEGHEKQKESFKQFSEKMDLKLHGVETSVHLRLDAQKDKIKDMDKKIDDLAEHVGILKLACFFAKWFKPGKLPEVS